MKKLDLGRTINTLANIGVIAGIIFLAVELNQNNELLELEARATYSEYRQNGWDRISSDPQLVDMFIKDRNGQTLTESEEFRLSAFWMGYLIRLEFEYLHFDDFFDRNQSIRRSFNAYPSFRKTWDGTTSGSRSAGKDNFSEEFVRHLEQHVKTSG